MKNVFLGTKSFGRLWFCWIDLAYTNYPVNRLSNLFLWWMVWKLPNLAAELNLLLFITLSFRQALLPLYPTDLGNIWYKLIFYLFSSRKQFSFSAFSDLTNRALNDAFKGADPNLNFFFSFWPILLKFGDYT